MSKQEQYELECVCGRKISTFAEEVKCESCGRTIRVEWKPKKKKKEIKETKQ